MQSSSCGKEDEAKTVQKFVTVLPSFASRSAKHQEILNNCVDLLGFLLQKDGTGKFPLGCLRMLTNISKEDVRLQVSKMLWARLQQLRSGEGIDSHCKILKKGGQGQYLVLNIFFANSFIRAPGDVLKKITVKIYSSAFALDIFSELKSHRNFYG